MQNVVTIGRRLVPVEHIALVEPFDPAAKPEFNPEKPFKARIVLLNRDTVLTEATPKEFADTHGFRMLADDNVATNPGIMFRIETFAATEHFTPTKPYVTRIRWRDQDGNDQSKLLLTKPEAVIAIALRGAPESGSNRKEPPRRPARSRPRRGQTAAPEK
jgi:hypothetical protein